MILLCRTKVHRGPLIFCVITLVHDEDINTVIGEDGVPLTTYGVDSLKFGPNIISFRGGVKSTFSSVNRLNSFVDL